MDEVSAIEGSEHGLRHADVSFHAAREHGVASGGKRLHFATELVAAEAGEFELIVGGDAVEQGGDFGHGTTEAF